MVSKPKIKKIYHTSDWHIFNDKNHDMFLEARDLLIADIKKDMLKNNYSYDEVVLVVAGDFLNDFNDISNEASQILIETLQMLVKICRIVGIIGNHDLNHTNLSELDSLTPIFSALDNPNIILLKNSDCYVIDNLVFCVYSFLEHNVRPYYYQHNQTEERIRFYDYNIMDDAKKLEYTRYDSINELQKTHSREEYTYVALYHDPITGSSDTSIEFKEDTHHGRVIGCEIFDGVHFGALGDIHKHQCINYGDIPLVYPSSLTQDRISVSATNRGYVHWDIATKEWTFHKLPFTYYTYHIKINTLADIDNDTYKIVNL